MALETTSVTFPSVNACIYCEAIGVLSREHIVPAGLSGEWVLPKASCQECAKITSKVELHLLRGHWLPHRVRLGLRSRRPNLRQDFAATIDDEYGVRKVLLKNVEYPGMVVCTFSAPTVLHGEVRSGAPLASGIGWLQTGDANSFIQASDPRPFQGTRHVTMPADLDVAMLMRFLAKVGWSYAVGVFGLSTFRERFVQKLILGDTDGANSYVGQGTDFPDLRLPGDGLHALLVRRHDDDVVSVCMQLFRESSRFEPPIYEVAVGRVSTSLLGAAIARGDVPAPVIGADGKPIWHRPCSSRSQLRTW